MGDFEDVFGAGADADSIIDGYSNDYNRASHVEKANWFGSASAEKNEIAIAMDEFDIWCKKITQQGGKRGPRFSSYSELGIWDKTNKREHVRRRTPTGGFQVFYFD